MRQCDEAIQKTLELVDLMNQIADEGDKRREDVGCGVLYGVLRDSAYKIKKLAEEEREAHIRKGWWKSSKVKAEQEAAEKVEDNTDYKPKRRRTWNESK